MITVCTCTSDIYERRFYKLRQCNSVRLSLQTILWLEHSSCGLMSTRLGTNFSIHHFPHFQNLYKNEQHEGRTKSVSCVGIRSRMEEYCLVFLSSMREERKGGKQNQPQISRITYDGGGLLIGTQFSKERRETVARSSGWSASGGGSSECLGLVTRGCGESETN